MRFGWKLASSLLSCAAAASAAAGSFSIAPIRVELGGAHRTEALTIHNDGDAPLTLQLHVSAWSQSGGEESYADTRDLLITPPVLQIPAHGDQIVRAALRRDPAATQELSYRIFFDEIPGPMPKDFVGLKVALHVSLPVFVAPGAKAAPQVTWQAHWNADGTLRVDAENHGAQHLQVSDFELNAGGATVHAPLARYVLPGSRISWTLKPPPGVAHDAPLSLHVFSDQGELRADVALAGS
ncbi:MAG TPA: fimbria/pilus periplasmic chaperone [Steroidobacteraceae bacterium]|nr:fimbria/pilus periplasmic chaperone [Steroidobacteraceae bacterium]